MNLHGCTRQTALERQYLSCTYLAHRELESVVIVIIIIIIIIIVVVVVVGVVIIMFFFF